MPPSRSPARQLVRGSKQLLRAALQPLAQRYASRRPALSPALWDLEITSDGQLAYEGVALSSLLGTWGSPLHVVQEARLRRNAEDFLAINAGAASPRVEVFYSYKTNPIPGVLQVLHGAGIGAEAISPYELWLALKLGVDPERIIYNGPAKSDASLREAMLRNILLINVNHGEEVARLVPLARALGKRPRVGVRVGTRDGWSGQFGSALETGEAWTTAQQVHASAVLKLSAVHAHLGGALRTRAQLERLVAEVLGFADALHERLGVSIEWLDFGGSLATPTVAHLDEADRRLASALLAEPSAPDPAATLSIRDYVRCLVEQVEAHYAHARRPVPRIALEPGRAMTANAQLLLASVVTLKESLLGPPHVILDAGINLAESVRFEYHQLFAASRMQDALARTYRVAGPICSPGDVLYPAWRGPHLQAGDVVAVMDAGAYFVPFATSFSFPQPAIIALAEGQARLLRRAETFDDLVSLDALTSSAQDGGAA